MILKNIEKKLDTERLKEKFGEYCDWCWGNGYGDCSVCRQQYEGELKRRGVTDGE